MPRQGWLSTAVVVSVALGCGERPDRGHDSGRSDANTRVCQGDHWSGSKMMIDAIADCTAITGDLTLTGNELSMVELPTLTRIDGIFSVWGNPALTHVAIPKLTRVGGYLHVSYNGALTSLELPALAKVNENAVSSMSDLLIGDNPQLPTCQADAIRDQLLARGFHGSIAISGNSDTCPP